MIIALLANTYRLYQIAINQTYIIRKIKKMKDVIVFFFQGGIILILSIFIDSYFLYSNLYTENEKEESSIEKTYH